MTGPVAKEGLRRSSPNARAATALVVAVAWRPSLWPVAVTETLRMARRGWWRQWPPLPLPDPDLWRFRLETAYGGEAEMAPTSQDVRSFLRWCRDVRDWRRG
ncbi:MAG: hypothetical protein ABSH04_00335 [Acidimicrobiales bacterium]